jgi:soluble lytic murein transglycosylase
VLPLAKRTYVLLGATVLLLACGGKPGTADSDALDIATLPPRDGDSTPRPAKAPPSTPSTPTLTPTPIPAATRVDLSEARRLESEGDLEGAASLYLAAAARTGPSQQEGILGAARLLLELERPAQARVLLEPYVDAAPPLDAAPARFLLARAYAALSLFDLSLRQYDLYIQSGRPAAPYARLERARILAETGQAAAAASEAQLGLAAPLHPAVRPAFLLAVAQGHERAGNLDAAVASYQSLLSTSLSPVDQALALAQLGALKARLGDPSGTADYQRLIATYPSSPRAREALDTLIAAGVATDPFVRGLVYYRHNEYEPAAAAFAERTTAEPNVPSSAESFYYLAAIYEARGQLADAKDFYSRAFNLNPASHLADDALWWRGRLLEDEGRIDEALVLYAQVARDYSASPFAGEAAFRRGLLPYRSGRYRDAASLWAESADLLSDPFERQRVLLWQGKALLKAGDRDAAHAVLQPLSRSAEDDYYGIRALSLLANEHGQPKATRDDRANLTRRFDIAAAEAWLAERTGRSPGDPAVAAIFADSRWLRAEELRLLGRGHQAEAEVMDLIEAHAQDPLVMYALARDLQEKGLYSVSARAGQRLLRVLATNPNQGLPPYLLSLSYPAAFPALVQKHAAAERISPLLLLAFIRQESFFQPRAESPAGALGLTQVLPSTGRQLATRLGISPFDPDQLLHADINLRFGARYMAEQLNEFSGNLYEALAAYNAGPQAARRWRDRAARDGDLFLEVVEFAETRKYVEFVAENYAIYRFLYGGEARPTLPAD